MSEIRNSEKVEKTKPTKPMSYAEKASTYFTGINRLTSRMKGQTIQTYYCKDKKSGEGGFQSYNTGVMCRKQDDKNNKKPLPDDYIFKCFNDNPGTLISDNKTQGFLNYITEFNDDNNESKCKYDPSWVMRLIKPLSILTNYIGKDQEIKSFKDAKYAARREFFYTCDDLLEYLNGMKIKTFEEKRLKLAFKKSDILICKLNIISQPSQDAYNTFKTTWIDNKIKNITKHSLDNEEQKDLRIFLDKLITGDKDSYINRWKKVTKQDQNLPDATINKIIENIIENKDTIIDQIKKCINKDEFEIDIDFATIFKLLFILEYNNFTDPFFKMLIDFDDNKKKIFNDFIKEYSFSTGLSLVKDKMNSLKNIMDTFKTDWDYNIILPQFITDEEAAKKTIETKYIKKHAKIMETKYSWPELKKKAETDLLSDKDKLLFYLGIEKRTKLFTQIDQLYTTKTVEQLSVVFKMIMDEFKKDTYSAAHYIYFYKILSNTEKLKNLLQNSNITVDTIIKDDNQNTQGGKTKTKRTKKHTKKQKTYKKTKKIKKTHKKK